jgi:mRNA-degrading endonuclease YafQ of YafQ-DinJ toxin-antitoxin module
MELAHRVAAALADELSSVILGAAPEPLRASFPAEALTYLIRYRYIHAVWGVYEHRRVVKQLASLPQEILKRYEKWKDIAMVSGLVGLRLVKGFHDEALQGELQEHRSSRLSLQYRVIYKLNAKDRIFQVISITPHDYRRI